MRLLGLCGSLRKDSRNMALLQLIQTLTSSDIKLEISDKIGLLPMFNPDLANDGLAPDIVRRFEESVANAGGIVIACPEYAHGIPGAFKNALDWLVGGVALSDAHVMIVNASSRSLHVQEQLHEVLGTMSAKVLKECCCTIPHADDMPEDLLTRLSLAIDRFSSTCKNVAEHKRRIGNL